MPDDGLPAAPDLAPLRDVERAAEHLGGGEDEHGAHALAARHERVAHRLDDDVGLRARRRQRGRERRLGFGDKVLTGIPTVIITTVECREAVLKDYLYPYLAPETFSVVPLT